MEITFSFHTFNLKHFREFIVCHVHTKSPTLVKCLKPAFETHVLNREFFKNDKLQSEVQR